MSRRLCLLVATLALTPTLTVGALLALDVDLRPSTEYHPTLPSQRIACDVVDDAIAKLPRGDGDDAVEADEIGPGGWRHASAGRRFVTRGFTLDAEHGGYEIHAGRARVGDNATRINDYPASLDLPQGFWRGVLRLPDAAPAISLRGAPGFRLPGEEEGAVRVALEDGDGDGVYEGCARAPYTVDLGPMTADGGSLLRRDYFKLVAAVDASGTVTYWEVTEITLFRDVTGPATRIAARRRG